MAYYAYANSSTSTSNFSYTATITVAPPRDANREWVERTLDRRCPPGLDSKEIQRVRSYLEELEFSPAVPFDPTIARSTFRRLMREHHPDAGGDAARAKRLTSAWNELKLRGLVR